MEQLVSKEEIAKVLDRVCSTALAVDEALHLWVPTSGLVTEVDARVEQLLHCDDCHVESLPAVSVNDTPRRRRRPQ